MGKRGPVPRNLNVRELHGDRKDRIEGARPKLPFSEPECPEYLGEEGLAIWEEILEDLRRLNNLAKCDGPALAAYVEAVLINTRAAQEINELGLMVKGYRGSRVKNPALTPWRDSADKIRAFAREFGLSPAARSGVKFPEAPPDGDEKPVTRLFS